MTGCSDLAADEDHCYQDGSQPKDAGETKIVSKTGIG
jgi:hypothetical protein